MGNCRTAMAGLGSPLSPYNRLSHPYGFYSYSYAKESAPERLSYLYSQRYGPYWHSRYYHDHFCVDEDGNEMSAEEAKMKFDSEWEKEEARVQQLRWLEEREEARVQQESRNDILRKVSARYAEVADQE